MKRYITIINIIFITAIVYYSVNGFYKIATSKLDNMNVSPVAAKSISAVEKEKKAPLTDYDTIFEHSLFGKATGKPKVPGRVEVDKLKQTDLKLKLWGTVTGDADKAYAVVESNGGTQNLYRTGDAIQNATVKMILREKIILSVNNKDEILEIEKQQTLKNVKPNRARPRLVRSRTVALKRPQIESAFQDVNKLMQQVNIRPHFERGIPDGLTLTGIKPDSIFRKMGLISGDIITAVDGETIQSVEDALKFYESLKSAATVKLDIKRRGRARTIEYKIE